MLEITNETMWQITQEIAAQIIIGMNLKGDVMYFGKLTTRLNKKTDHVTVYYRDNHCLGCSDDAIAKMAEKIIRKYLPACSTGEGMTT